MPLERAPERRNRHCASCDGSRHVVRAVSHIGTFCKRYAEDSRSVKQRKGVGLVDLDIVSADDEIDVLIETEQVEPALRPRIQLGGNHANRITRRFERS